MERELQALTDGQLDRLLAVLEMVETAETKSEAVLLDEESRSQVGEIRETIEAET